MSCINPNLKEFKLLQYKFGRDAAENIVRSYSNFKKSSEFVYPTVRDAGKFIQSNKDNQVQNVINNIENNNADTENIIRNLKGIISNHNGSIYITKGWLDEGGSTLREEQKKVIFQENYNRVKFLQDTYPKIFEIKDTPKDIYIKAVNINGSNAFVSSEESLVENIEDNKEGIEEQIVAEEEKIDIKESTIPSEEMKVLLETFEKDNPIFSPLPLAERITFLELVQQGIIDQNCKL